jgi:hypothetical protein
LGWIVDLNARHGIARKLLVVLAVLGGYVLYLLALTWYFDPKPLRPGTYEYCVATNIFMTDPLRFSPPASVGCEDLPRDNPQSR